MNKLSRFTSYGIEDDEVVTKDGDTEVVVTAEPPKDTEEQEVNNDASTEDTPPIETTNVDLEPKDDSEETDEEKEKKIKIEIEIAQEQIDAMSQAITSLENISKEMETSLQRGGLPVQGRAIARTSLQHIAKQFGIEESPIASLEGYGYQIDDFHATRISVEGIKETVMKIIEFIKEKIKNLLDLIFKRDTVKKLEKEKIHLSGLVAELLVDNSDKSKESVKNNLKIEELKKKIDNYKDKNKIDESTIHELTSALEKSNSPKKINEVFNLKIDNHLLYNAVGGDNVDVVKFFSSIQNLSAVVAILNNLHDDVVMRKMIQVEKVEHLLIDIVNDGKNEFEEITIKVNYDSAAKLYKEISNEMSRATIYVKSLEENIRRRISELNGVLTDMEPEDNNSADKVNVIKEILKGYNKTSSAISSYTYKNAAVVREISKFLN